MNIPGLSLSLDDLVQIISAARDAGGLIKDGHTGLRAVRDQISGNPKARSEAAVRADIGELLEKLMQAQIAQAEILDRLNQMKAALMQQDRHDRERERYLLVQTPTGHFALSHKPGQDGGTEPHHYLCHPCFEDGKKAILQPHNPHTLRCPRCKAFIHVSDPPQVVVPRSRTLWNE